MVDTTASHSSDSIAASIPISLVQMTNDVKECLKYLYAIHKSLLSAQICFMLKKNSFCVSQVLHRDREVIERQKKIDRKRDRDR